MVVGASGLQSGVGPRALTFIKSMPSFAQIVCKIQPSHSVRIAKMLPMLPSDLFWTNIANTAIGAI